jgi:nucleotide-binding universal stress UspA family protein
MVFTDMVTHACVSGQHAFIDTFIIPAVELPASGAARRTPCFKEFRHEQSTTEPILVPLDGSTTAEAVLSHLRRIVDRHESQLILLQALPIPTARREGRREVLAPNLVPADERGYPTLPSHPPGMPAEAILELAEEERATLIAMTTHGGPAAPAGAGQRRGEGAPGQPSAGPGHPLVPARQSRGKLEELPVRNVLVPLDGSRFSLAVLEPVLEFVRGVDAHVRLLHVNEPTPYDGRWDSPTRP